MLLSTQETQASVGREAVDDQHDQHNFEQRSYGADFWPMTFILIVIVVASFVALGRLVEFF